jgi:signal recognition particle subunit SRP54
MFKLYETAINSMTPEERKRPQIINMSRRRRIAKGSGLKENALGQMLNEFEQMRKMFQQFRQLMGPGMGMPFNIPGMPGAGNLPKVPPSFPQKLPPGFPMKGPAGFRKKGKRR